MLFFDPAKKVILQDLGGSLKSLHRICGTLNDFLVGLTIAAYIAYLGLIVVWCALGAVLNPHRYSPYGSAAVVFGSFVAASRSLFLRVSSELRKCLRDIVRERLFKRATKIAKNIPSRARTSAVTNEAVLARLRAKARSLGLETIDPTLLLTLDDDTEDDDDEWSCDRMAGSSAEIKDFLAVETTTLKIFFKFFFWFSGFRVFD